MRRSKNSLLTTQQAANVIGVSRIYIQQAILRKRLFATKLGRDWLIKEKDLVEFNKNRGKRGNPAFVKKK